MKDLYTALSPFITQLIGVFLAAALAAVIPAFAMLFDKLKVDRNGKLSLMVEAAAQSAIRYGFSRLPNVSLADAISVEQFRQQIIKEGTDYLQSMLPSALKKLGLGNDAIASFVAARLASTLAELAQEHLLVAKTVQVANNPDPVISDGKAAIIAKVAEGKVNR